MNHVMIALLITFAVSTARWASYFSRIHVHQLRTRRLRSRRSRSVLESPLDRAAGRRDEEHVRVRARKRILESRAHRAAFPEIVVVPEDRRAGRSRNFGRAVAGPIVDHDDLGHILRRSLN